MKLGNKELVERLSRSAIYRDYARAFRGATMLPLALSPVENRNLSLHGTPNENPFCALMAQRSKACAACLEMQRRLTEHLRDKPRSAVCFAGLTDSAVPVRVGVELVGFLQTGQVMLKEPSEKRFVRVARQLVDWGLKVDLRKAREAYFHTRVLDPKQYRSMVQLLEIFGRHLSILSNEITLQTHENEPLAITRARRFIAANAGEGICLGRVAKAVNTSTFYFCKLFKQATGLTFTEYLARVRVEKAKRLLLDGNRRISEVAYDVGFQSLTHFNRTFRKIAGQSPTQYRHGSAALA